MMFPCVHVHACGRVRKFSDVCSEGLHCRKFCFFLHVCCVLSGLFAPPPSPCSCRQVEAHKRVTLARLPTILILHLKRFIYDKAGGSQKVQKHVQYPVELEISKGKRVCVHVHACVCVHACMCVCVCLSHANAHLIQLSMCDGSKYQLRWLYPLQWSVLKETLWLLCAQHVCQQYLSFVCKDTFLF